MSGRRVPPSTLTPTVRRAARRNEKARRPLAVIVDVPRLKEPWDGETRFKLGDFLEHDVRELAAGKVNPALRQCCRAMLTLYEAHCHPKP